MNKQELIESFNISEENIKKIKDRAESKLKKGLGVHYPLFEKINSANDWVQKNKETLISISILFAEVRKIISELTEKFMTNQEYIDTLYNKLYLIDQSFSIIAMAYVKLADNQKRPLTTQATHKLRIEMLSFWENVADELEKTRATMTEFRGRLIMRGLWEKYPKLHPFFDRIEKTTYKDVERRIKNNKNPLGSEFDVFTDDED